MQITWTNLAVADLDNLENTLTRAHDSHVAEEDVFRIINNVEKLPSLSIRQPGDVIGTFEYPVDGLSCVVVYQIEEVEEQVQVLRILLKSEN